VTTRRHFLGAAMGAMALTAARRLRAADGKPNIIFILADDLGYGDLGCFGQKQIQTPHIDRMAAQGMRFTNHYAGGAVCAPSRFTLMMGRHIGHAHTTGQGQCLHADDVTIADILKGQGYATAAIGKWGLGDEGKTGVPLEQGFDSFFGYLNQTHAHNYWPEWLWRDDKKVTFRNVVVRMKNDKGRKIGGAATKRVDYVQDLFMRETLTAIDRMKDEAFFLYLPFTIPHANNQSSLLKLHGMETPDYGIYKDKDWPEPQKGHAAMISRLDSDVGLILERLRAHGIAENTLVIFTSDNGPHGEGGARPEFFASSGPLRGHKGRLHEGGIRVPAIAWMPGTIKPGTTTDHPSAFWDFLPTACELVGATPPEDTDGVSYLPTLLGKPQKPHDAFYWEHNRWLAVRAGKWKLVRLDGKPELYDLSADIGEETDLADKQPDVVERLLGIMQRERGKPLPKPKGKERK